MNSNTFAAALALGALLMTPAFGQFSKIKDAVKSKTPPPAVGSSGPTAAPSAQANESGGAAGSEDPPATAAAASNSQPNIPKHALHVYTRQVGMTASHPTWTWLPVAEFYLRGPVAAGSQVVFQFYDPAKKPWVEFRPKTPELKAGQAVRIKITDQKVDDNLAAIHTGLLTFRIILKNELQGAEAVLYDGSYTVKRFLDNVDKGTQRYQYYVDHDWTLPVAYILGNTANNPLIPYLQVDIWYRRNNYPGDFQAYLFYNGQQIAESSTTNTDFTVQANGGEHNYDWALHAYRFMWALRNNDPNSPHTKSLAKQPGEYEVKVLRKGALVRTLKFTVKPDGRIDDGGIPAANGVLAARHRLAAIVPVKILGDIDGPYDKEAWKTAGYYGNPLKALPLEP